MNAVTRIITLLDQQSRLSLWAIAIILMIVLALMDYWTGYSASFAIFYLIPVTLAAWSLSFRSAVILSIGCAILWLTVNYLVIESSLLPLIAYWNASSRLGFFLIVSALVAEVRRLLEQEKRLSRVDSLTGILNRRAFYEVLAAEVLRAKRYHLPFALVYIDLDYFKRLNDQYGHTIGDEALCTITSDIQQNIRETDYLARLGGDEFALLMVRTDESTARAVLPRIRASLLNKMSVSHWPITFSIGVLMCHNVNRSVEQLIQDADRLMYRSKKMRQGSIVFATCHSRG